MRLLALILVGAVGALVAAWGLPRGGRAARVGGVAGALALAGVTIAAMLQRTSPRLTDAGEPLTGVFDAHLVSTEYLRLAVGLWGIESLVLLFLAWLIGGRERVTQLLPATLAAITGGTVALASADLSIAAASAAATGLAALLVVLRAEGPAAVAAGAREVRVALVSGCVVLAAIVVVPLVARLALIASGVGLDEATEEAAGIAGPVLGLVTLAIALAVSARWGLLPFHLRVSRLTDLVPPVTLPLLVAWVPLPLTVVTFAVVDRLITSLAQPLDGERALLVLLVLVTLVGASLAALVQDDLRHAIGYLVIADAGILLLAIAALDTDAWGPGRVWVIAVAASKTALAAWAAVAEERFETRSLPELRGWIRRSPLLGAALVVTLAATFGLPGWVALDARAILASGGSDQPWGSPWRELVLLAGFATLPAYLRLLWIGGGRVTSRVDRAAPERIVRRRRPLETLPVVQEAEGGTTAAATTEAPVEAAGASVAAEATEAAEAAGRRPTPRAGIVARRTAFAERVAAAIRRDRTELLSGAVLALALLAALTSWGALDIRGAASEPAPILLGTAD